MLACMDIVPPKGVSQAHLDVTSIIRKLQYFHISYSLKCYNLKSFNQFEWNFQRFPKIEFKKDNESLLSYSHLWTSY